LLSLSDFGSVAINLFDHLSFSSLDRDGAQTGGGLFLRKCCFKHFLISEHFIGHFFAPASIIPRGFTPLSNFSSTRYIMSLPQKKY